MIYLKPSENDEFDEQIEIQESDNPVFTEETILSESEYISSVDESISSVAAETSELLDSTVMDTALITAEAVEAALGAIGIVIMVGMMIINVVEVFANPKSTTIDKIDAGVKFLVPIYGFLSTIINAFGLSPEDKVRAKVNDRISNSNNVYSYAPNSEEIKNFTERMVSSVKTGLSLSCISICSSNSSFSDGVHIVALTLNVNKALKISVEKLNFVNTIKYPIL
jgi:hypothetical protein